MPPLLKGGPNSSFKSLRPILFQYLLDRGSAEGNKRLRALCKDKRLVWHRIDISREGQFRDKSSTWAVPYEVSGGVQERLRLAWDILCTFEASLDQGRAQARLVEVPYVVLDSDDVAAIEPKHLEEVFTASRLLTPTQLNECDEASKAVLEAQARRVFDDLCQSLFSRLQSSSRSITRGSLHLTLTAALAILDKIYPMKQGASTFIEYQQEKLEYVSRSPKDPAVAGTPPSLFEHGSSLE